MSRSIHKTVAKVASENSKCDLEDPDHPDIAALAQKRRYKSAKQSERKAGKPQREPKERGHETPD